jgi:hypothetical protein
MRSTIRKVMGIAFGLAVVSQVATAQETGFFSSPVFVFQPGLVTTDFIDAGDAQSNTEFNFRVVTALPVRAIPRTTLVAIVQWTPFNKTGGFTSNAPGFVYGPVFNLFSTSALALDFDVLGAFSPAAEEGDESSYTHKLVLEADLFLKIGSMMMADPNSRFRNLALYAFLAHVTTGIPSEASPWVLLTGLSLPLAP